MVRTGPIKADRAGSEAAKDVAVSACQFGNLVMGAKTQLLNKPNDSKDLRNIFTQWHGGCYKGVSIAVDCQSCAERLVLLH